MDEVAGQRPRQTPMKCWGCNGDHKYKVFPHRRDNMRVVHNVQQEKIVEDMGKRVPRMYAALDNKKVEFQ
jgi:hypothetical protein